MTYCGNCGHEVGGQFCGECGQRVALEDQQIEESPDTTATLPVAAEPPGQAASRPPPGTGAADVQATAQAHPPAPLPGRRTVPVSVLAMVGVGLIAVLAIAGWRLHWIGGSEHVAAPATSTVTMTVTPTDRPSVTDTSTESTQTPETATAPTTKSPSQLRTEAYATLQHMVSRDAQLNPIRGQWVAQLASKTEGIVDTSQQATPFTIPDILAEIKALQANPQYGSIVRVVHQGDWANSTAGPKPMWVTFADINKPSKAAVVSWCEDHFTQRGNALLDVCYPRQMSPK